MIWNVCHPLNDCKWQSKNSTKIFPVKIWFCQKKSFCWLLFGWLPSYLSLFYHRHCFACWLVSYPLTCCCCWSSSSSSRQWSSSYDDDHKKLPDWQRNKHWSISSIFLLFFLELKIKPWLINQMWSSKVNFFSLVSLFNLKNEEKLN